MTLQIEIETRQDDIYLYRLLALIGQALQESIKERGHVAPVDKRIFYNGADVGSWKITND